LALRRRLIADAAMRHTALPSNFGNQFRRFIHRRRHDLMPFLLRRSTAIPASQCKSAS
jgi:hypothetical protein